MNDEYLRRHEHEEFAKGVDREQVRQNSWKTETEKNGEAFLCMS